MTQENNIEQKTAKTMVGKVVSNKMDKTIVVEDMYKVKHELYGKYIKRFTKVYAHDENNVCRIGDLVKIQQTRPLSKTKRWSLVEVIKQEEQ